MTDNDYKELPLNRNVQIRKDYWEIGKGLQKVDYLDTSEYLYVVL